MRLLRGTLIEIDRYGDRLSIDCITWRSTRGIRQRAIALDMPIAVSSKLFDGGVLVLTPPPYCEALYLKCVAMFCIGGDYEPQAAVYSPAHSPVHPG